MKFDINNYKGKYVMHCKTEEEAKEFCDYLHSVGKKWFDGDSYQSNTLWTIDAECTGYNFNEGYRGSVESYTERNFTILEWSDFNWSTEFTKADLKDGMVVECRNGNRYLVVGDRLLRHSGYMCFREYTDNLEEEDDYYTDCSYTIVKVYKSNKPHILNHLFDDDYLTLIWERKEEKPEPEEMTLEEVCKALGKEIKIVKG